MITRIWTKGRVLLLIALFIGMQGLSAFAQNNQSSLAGYITDPNGLNIVGAKVTVISDSTSRTKVATADSDGHFMIDGLDVGTYSVQVEAKGFQPMKQTGYRIDLGQKATLNVPLKVGSESTIVTVNASTQQVQTETGEQSFVISGEQVQSIAVNGRNPVALATLVPGASSMMGDESGKGVTGSAGVSFNGGRADQNAWLIDGSWVRDTGNGTSLHVYPAMDAVGEFRVLTSNYGADLGSASSGIVNIAIRRGANSFHGSGYWFVRNEALDANYYFNKVNTPVTPKAKHRENDYGYTVGGPIRRNKDFFFWSQEFKPITDAYNLSTHTPDVNEQGGNFSVWSAANKNKALTPITTGPKAGCVLDATHIDPTCIDPQAKALIATGIFPKQTTDATAGNFTNFIDPATQPSTYREEIIRVDHTFNQNNQLLVHYIHDKFIQTPPVSPWSGDSFPTVTFSFNTPGQNFAVDFTSTIKPTLVNELNFNIGENNIHLVNSGIYKQPAGVAIPKVYQHATQYMPNLDFNGGYGNYEVGMAPWANNNLVYEFSDMLTQSLGRHSLKYGGLYIYQLKNQNNGNTNGAFGFNGNITGNSFSDFLLGLPNNYSENAKQQNGLFRFSQFEPFVQDDFRVNKKLTLNMGVRWYYIPHLYEANNAVDTFVPSAWVAANAPTVDPSNGHITLTGSQTQLNGMVQAGKGIGKGLAKTYYGDFAPRLGFAYDPWGTGKTVIRGGFGMGYYREEGNDMYGIISNIPYVQSVSLTNPTLANPAGGSQAPLSIVGVQAIDKSYQPPRSENYSMGVQRDVGLNTIVTLSYVGSHSDHLTRTINLNQPTPIAGYNFDPAVNAGKVEQYALPSVKYHGFRNINYEVSDGNAAYNSIQVNVDKAFTHGVRVQSAFTYGRGIDNASGFGNQPQDAYNRKAEWAQQDQDRKYISITNYIWDLPIFRNHSTLAGKTLGGWQFAGLVTLQSGTPWTTGLSAPQQGLASRANQNGKISYPKTVAHWFTADAFSQPAPGFFGTAHRHNLISPGYAGWDTSLYKDFAIKELIHLQARFEGFNVLNHANFNGADLNYGDSNFGRLTSAHNARQIQIGGRVTF